MTPSFPQAVPLLGVEGHSKSLTEDVVECRVQLVASLFPSPSSLLVDSVGCSVLYRMTVVAEMHLVPVPAVWMADLVVMTVVPIPGLLRRW